MEYVDGESLAVRLKRGRMPIDAVIDVGRQLSSALAAAHARGIVHRDLKPGNVHVTPEGVAKVLDFGIANLAESLTADSGATTTQPKRLGEGRQVGTPPYMSPEQLLGRAVDERSDVFSLGVVLFEMATGRRPFESTDPLELIMLQAKGAPRADAIDAHVPERLAAIISETLQTDVHRRPPSAAAVQAALHVVAHRSRKRSVRELIRLWSPRIAVGVPLAIVGLAMLGEFKTLVFNNNFGRTGPFSRFGVESWQSLLVWGLAGNAAKLVAMTVMTFIALEIRWVFRALELVGPIGRVTGGLRVACRKALKSLGLDHQAT